MQQYSNYDLQERTAKFGENVIKFCKELDKNAVSEPLIRQVVRSTTSVGANYLEANSASSRKDFTNKIYICKKEAEESKHWFRMLSSCFPDRTNELRIL
jgi:four helix bundle protein